MSSKRPEAGTVLVQVLIASLLLATAVTGIIGMLLQGLGQTGGRPQRKEQGILAANQVLEALKNYVTADHSGATQAFAPNGCWDIVPPGSSCTGNSWALSDGAHDVGFLMPAGLKPFQIPCPGFTGSLIYTVSRSRPSAVPKISVQVCWQEPKS